MGGLRFRLAIETRMRPACRAEDDALVDLDGDDDDFLTQACVKADKGRQSFA